jgi:hypothetical protein
MEGGREAEEETRMRRKNRSERMGEHKRKQNEKSSVFVCAKEREGVK